MMENFSAKEQARTLEDMGYRLLHEFNVPGPSRLADGLGALSPAQAEELNAQLKWDNWKPTTDPSVEMYRDESGHITGIGFRPAISDTTAKTTFMMIGIGKGNKTQNPQFHLRPNK